MLVNIWWGKETLGGVLYCNLKNTRGPKQAKNKYINIKKTKMSMIRKTNGILYSPDKAEYE